MGVKDLPMERRVVTPRGPTCYSLILTAEKARGVTEPLRVEVVPERYPGS